MTKRLLEPIYSIVPNEASFSIIELQLSNENPPTKTHTLFKFEKCWEKVKERDSLFDFYLALMILLSAEFFQRKAIIKKLAPKTRNIEFKTRTIHCYLEKVMEKMKIPELSVFDEISSILDTAFHKIKLKYGFPLDDPCEYSYTITDEVLAEAGDDEDCELYLSSRKNIGLITPQIFDEIKLYLKEHFSSKDTDIMIALKATESREHLSIFSIDAENYTPYVHIVNPEKGQIKLENWKFIYLIENPNTPIELYDFDKNKDAKNKYFKTHKFIYNKIENGLVLGQLNPETSQFQIVNYDESASQKHGPKEIFTVDSTYLLCLYVTLKRLKEDKVRFTKFLESAEAQTVSKEIFERVFFH